MPSATLRLSSITTLRHRLGSPLPLAESELGSATHVLTRAARHVQNPRNLPELM